MYQRLTLHPPQPAFLLYPHLYPPPQLFQLASPPLSPPPVQHHCPPLRSSLLPHQHKRPQPPQQQNPRVSPPPLVPLSLEHDASSRSLGVARRITAASTRITARFGALPTNHKERGVHVLLPSTMTGPVAAQCQATSQYHPLPHMETHSTAA